MWSAKEIIAVVKSLHCLLVGSTTVVDPTSRQADSANM